MNLMTVEVEKTSKGRRLSSKQPKKPKAPRTKRQPKEKKPKKRSLYDLFIATVLAEGTTFEGCIQAYYPIDRGPEEGPGERIYREKCGLNPMDAKLKKLRDIPEQGGKELKSIFVSNRVKPTKKCPFETKRPGITSFRAGASTSTLLEKGRIRALDAHVQKRCRTAVEAAVENLKSRCQPRPQLRMQMFQTGSFAFGSNTNTVEVSVDDLDKIVDSLKHARQDEDEIIELLNGTLSIKQRQRLPHDVWSIIENHVKPSVGLKELDAGLVVMVPTGYLDVPVDDYDDAFMFTSVSKGLASYAIRYDYLERRLAAALLRTASVTNDFNNAMHS